MRLPTSPLDDLAINETDRLKYSGNHIFDRNGMNEFEMREITD